MSTRPVLRLCVLCVVLAATPAGAQVQDTLGVVDTLRFGTVEASPGRPLAVPIVVTNDLECVSLAMPVAYSPSHLVIDSVTFAGGRAAHFGVLSGVIDNVRGRALVSAAQWSGAGMPPGSGPVAWLHMTLSAQAAIGSVLVIDTGYFNDPGKLLFLAGPGGSQSYLPAVVAGSIQVVTPNHPPVFLVAGNRTVREGDSLIIGVTVGDLDGDPVEVHLVNRPPGARFTDRGNGEAEMAWKVPFVGPYSSLGGPHVFYFVADDGQDARTAAIEVTVVNVNRPPILFAPDTLFGSAFDSLEWQATASDPDLDPVTLSVQGAPAPAQVSPGNPLQIQWRPEQADTGTYSITIFADDHNGGLAQQTSVLRIVPGDRVEFALDTVAGYSGQTITFPVHMCNQEVVSGLELLFYLDPTAVTIMGIDRRGTRIEDWEMFVVDEDFAGRPGDIRIIARADINDGFPTPLLDPGEGPIINVHLQLIADERFAGLAFPARFVFRTALANTASDAFGEIIMQDEIAYRHGEVQIQLYADKLPGDINMNGLPFEIGDVVYFANYFSNPSKYPLSFEQRANSDTNGDGTPATIADLVYMIQVITGGGVGKAAAPSSDVIAWHVDEAGALYLEGSTLLGAILVTYRSAHDALPERGPASEVMTPLSGHEGELRRWLLYSLNGWWIDPDRGPVALGLNGVRIDRIEAADTRGRVVQTSPRVVLPAAPTLYGNYPNPFNPSTAIRFGLAVAGEVRIDIYNVLGHRVRALGGPFAAGDHELIWDGRDGAGRSVASGMYFYRFDSEGVQQVRRMLLLK